MGFQVSNDLNETFQQTQAQIQAFFEPQLVKLGLGKNQIETQPLEQLEVSLETVNDALQHPEQFGVLKIDMGVASGRLTSLITKSNPSFNYEIGVLPILLDRKKRILERISMLKGEQKVESFRDLIRTVKDPNTRLKLEEELADLESTSKESDEKLEEIRQQHEQQLLKVQLESAERIAKFAELIKTQAPNSETISQEITQLQKNLQKTTREKNKYQFFVNVLLVSIVVILGLYLIFALPQLVSWAWLLQHPRKLGLQMSGLLILAGICWTILDKDKSRRSLTIGSIVLATIVGIIQLL